MVNMLGLGTWQLIHMHSLVSIIVRLGGRQDIHRIGPWTLILDTIVDRQAYGSCQWFPCVQCSLAIFVLCNLIHVLLLGDKEVERRWKKK